MPLSLTPYQYGTCPELFSRYQGNGYLQLCAPSFYWPSAAITSTLLVTTSTAKFQFWYHWAYWPSIGPAAVHYNLPAQIHYWPTTSRHKYITVPLSLPPYQYGTGQGLFSGCQGNGHLPLFTLQFYWPSAVNCNRTDNTKVKTNATFLLETFTFIYLVFFNCNIQNDLHSCTENTIKHRT